MRVIAFALVFSLAGCVSTGGGVTNASFVTSEVRYRAISPLVGTPARAQSASDRFSKAKATSVSASVTSFWARKYLIVPWDNLLSAFS